MCKKCLKEPFPDRGTTCLDDGSYIMNFNGCGECGKIDLIKNGPKEEEKNEAGESEDAIIITFNHHCKHCDHIIAEHKYEFDIYRRQQLYTMECALCGQGDDSRNIYIEDGGRKNMLF